MATTVTLEELLEAGAHFGHQARRWNPKMAPFLYGVKDGVHVFDLAKTKEALEEAMKVLADYAKQGKSILIVGTKKQAKDRVKSLGKNAQIAYLNERWLGGTLTNLNQVLNSVRKLIDIEEGFKEGKFNTHTKKERLLLERDAEKLERNIGGIRSLTQKPDLIIIIDTHREDGAVKEAARMKVETIGIVDSNGDPTAVTWPIPMNDDAGKALDFILNIIEKTIMDAKGLKQEKKEVKPEAKEKKTKVKVEKKDKEQENVKA